MEIVNRNQVKPFITKDTSEIREILSPNNSGIRRQSLAEARVAAGKSTEEHYHMHSEEIYYILRGKGRMWIIGKSHDVRAGDGIVILPGRKHWIENTGQQSLVFLCCCAPAYTHEDTVLT